MGDLLKSERILNLLSENGEVINDAKSLVYNQIFPYAFIPETIDKGRTFICCDVDVQKALNKTFLIPQMYIWVFTHKSMLRLPSGGVRTDALCSEICSIINGSRQYGLGELNLTSVKSFSPITDYRGKAMTFTAKEYNRPAPSDKPVPSNRKLGVWHGVANTMKPFSHEGRLRNGFSRIYPKPGQIISQWYWTEEEVVGSAVGHLPCGAFPVAYG